MKDIEIIEVEEIPAIVKRKRSTTDETDARLDRIMSSNVKFGKVALNGTYSNAVSAYTSLKYASNIRGYPLKFSIRRYELYFERMDIM